MSDRPRCSMCGRPGVKLGAYYVCTHCDTPHPTGSCCISSSQAMYDGVGPNNRHLGGVR